MRNGFSLIELLMVLVIVGVLTLMAYPYYNANILKLNRYDAKHSLLQEQLQLENCYSQSGDYSKPCHDVNRKEHMSERGYYSISFIKLEKNSYTLEAQAIGKQKSDSQCLIFKTNEKNQNSSCLYQ